MLYQGRCHTGAPFAGHVLAVLILEEDVPASVATPLALSSTAPAADQVVRVVGFGSTANEAYDDGVRREVETTIGTVDEDGKLFEYGDATHGGCYGDMGGPILHDVGTGEAIVGLGHYGRQNCDGPSTATAAE